MSYTIQIRGDAQAILAELKAFPAAMAQAIAAALNRENELTLGHIQATKLSKRGPSTLGVISNRLRSSARRTEAVIQGNEVISAIGSNVEYAGAHEHGFTGSVQVRAHTRHVVQRDQFTVSKRGKRNQTASGFGRVRAFSRKMNIKARAPFGTGIEERADRYGTSVSNAILAAWSSGGAS
jgi:phage gpG-like protein